MCPPPVRLKLWLLMVAVASIGLVLGLVRRRIVFMHMAESYAKAANNMTAEMEYQKMYIRIKSMFWDQGTHMPPSYRASQRYEEWKLKQRKKSERLDLLRRKYERAARYPWLPVESDPPEPE